MHCLVCGVACSESTKKWSGTIITHPAGTNGLTMKVLYVAYIPTDEGVAALPPIAGLKYEGTNSKKIKDMKGLELENDLEECRNYWLGMQNAQANLVNVVRPTRKKKEVSKP